VIKKILMVILTAAALAGGAESNSNDQVDSVRALIEKRVETLRLISKEKQDWTLAREMVSERINVVQGEIATLREKISQTQESISDADKKRAELVAENEKLKDAANTLTHIVTKLESRVIALNERLPDPLRELIKPLSQRIPQDPAVTKLSLSQRFQNVIGILDAVNKFNREITVKSEVRTLTDGNTLEVTALYIGLGQAYYTGKNGTVAGVGRPGVDGWHWESANDAADQITAAVDILKGEKVADFVLVPIQIE